MGVSIDVVHRILEDHPSRYPGPESAFQIET
jgi:hypothetical protein